MMPTGGISLFLHLLINAFYRLMKYPRKIVPFLVIFAVASVVIIGGRAAIVNSLKDDNNLELLEEAFSVCKPVTQVHSENRVILRVDDVQADAYRTMTENMVNDAQKYNMRLVLGIIPKDLLQDKKLVRFLKKNSCNLEAALHGWSHVSDEKDNLFEFEEMSADEARVKIQDGKKILAQVFDNPVVTFIPPGNEISDDTKEVLDEEGIKYVSSGYVGGDFDMTAGTYDFPSKSLVSNDEILKRCEAKFGEKKPCIIVMHPQDYMTDDKPDSEKYRSYIDLLNKLSNDKVYSVTFSDLDSRKKQSTEVTTLFGTNAHPFQPSSIE
jgi:peptidoglycan/xylan/chitin deacetylase (PgdA/CDA1 family)